jgi:hypothetical protein
MNSKSLCDKPQCDSCQRATSFANEATASCTLFKWQRRWQSISIDLITDLPVTESGKDAIVVYVDRLCKMVYIDAIIKMCGFKRDSTHPEIWVLRLQVCLKVSSLTEMSSLTETRVSIPRIGRNFTKCGVPGHACPRPDIPKWMA